MALLDLFRAVGLFNGLTDEQLQRLADANPLPVLYPHSFWNEFVRRQLIFGERLDDLDRRV